MRFVLMLLFQDDLFFLWTDAIRMRISFILLVLVLKWGATISERTNRSVDFRDSSNRWEVDQNKNVTLKDIATYRTALSALHELTWDDNWLGNYPAKSWSANNSVQLDVVVRPDDLERRFPVRHLIILLYIAVHFYRDEDFVYDAMFRKYVDDRLQGRIWFHRLEEGLGQNELNGLRSSTESTTQNLEAADIFPMSDDSIENQALSLSSNFSFIPNIEIEYTRLTVGYKQFYEVFACSYWKIAEKGRREKAIKIAYVAVGNPFALIVDPKQGLGDLALTNTHVIRAMVEFQNKAANDRRYMTMNARISVIHEGKRRVLGVVSLTKPRVPMMGEPESTAIA